MSENAEDAPQWRKDFPTEWAADNYITRREFTKFLVLASGAMCAGNAFVAVQKLRHSHQTMPAVTVADTSELAVGAAKLFRYPTEDVPAVLIRLADGTFVAYLQRCTHLSCPVQYSQGEARLECPCHNGAFDAATGHVLSGPPPRALTRIALRIEGNSIVAHDLAMHDSEGKS